MILGHVKDTLAIALQEGQDVSQVRRGRCFSGWKSIPFSPHYLSFVPVKFHLKPLRSTLS